MQINAIKSLLPPLLVLLAGVLAMQYLVSQKPQERIKPPQPRTLVVETRTVQPAPQFAKITAWGRLSSAQPLALVADATGQLMPTSWQFLPGQAFRAGQLLLQVDDRQQRLALKRCKADLLNALAALIPDLQLQHPQQLPQWERWFRSLRFDAALPALPEVESEKIKRLLTRHQVYRYFYACADEEIALEKYRIVAPFDGTVLEADMREGANVRPGTRLGTLLNLEQLELVAELAVGDLAWIDRDAPVDIRAEQLALQLSGRILRVGRAVDSQTQTVPVYIQLQGRDGAALPWLADGLLLEADMQGQSVLEAVSVPLKNIYDENYVYLIRDGVLERRSVQIHRRETDRAIVTGLQAGEQLVVDLLQGVADGMPAESVASFEARSGAG